MEKEEHLQPRGSLDEKSSLERPENEEKQQNVETLPPRDEETNPNNETPPDTAATNKEPDWEYITGLKLILVLIAITLACFLMLLDNSIIATVSKTTLSLYPVYLHVR